MPNDPLQNLSQQQNQEQQALINRLLSRVIQPRMSGPSVAQSKPPQPVKELGGYANTPDQGAQLLTHNLFGLVANLAMQHKQEQLAHATNRIKSISDAIEDAYEIAQGDENKAKQLFMASPAVRSLQSKEGQKDIKQMEKLLQYDFLNPEKSKTVWHEALEQVARISGAEKVMKGLRGLMGQHQDKTAEDVKKQGELQHGEQQGRELASTMFGAARPDPTQRAEAAKILPSAMSAEGSDLRQRERLLFQDYEREQKQKFSSSIDSIKDPKVKAVAQGLQASMEGDEETANKYFDAAKKGYAVSTKPTPMNLNKAIDDAVNNPDPNKKKAAQNFISKYQDIQDRLLTNRGMAFGMGRLFNFYNSDTGQTSAMNGFQVQERLKQGEDWIMSGPVSPTMLLPMQQIVRSLNAPEPSGQSLRQQLVDDMKAFDNSGDRAIISRVLRENPAAYAQTETTLGVWLDQNLTGKLSPDGQKLVQDIKRYAEVFNRLRAITGQSSSEMNTLLLLGLLPNERTPNSKYGMQQLQQSFNFLDGMVQAPILGGTRFAGKSAPAKKGEAAKPEAKKGDPLSIF